ncbi:MAG: glycosyltransferase [Candidatus Thermoplasmatota archaeon]|nr:glycosyltransferase [Candidatus Thermoplasmatota archaeon]
MATPRVCVIIPTLRNAEELEIALGGLSNQTWNGPLEIAIVGPTDDPGQRIAEANGATWIDDQGSRTRADACNVALNVVNCDLVFFTDDDVWIPEDWVANLVRWFERDNVAGVGGPNFAPPDERSTFWQRVIDVTFCSKWVTAGTNYGNRGVEQLTKATQLPGVNAAYRKSVLDEVGGFDKGAIGCEDAMMDYRIESAGHQLWQDRDAIMWHRRRNPSRVRKQIRNYGLVRILASEIHPGMKSWSHNVVGMFPILVLTALASFILGSFNGGLSWPNVWDISLASVPMGVPRSMVHLPVSLAGLYVTLCWFGAALGTSPSRSLTTILMAPLMTFLMHWSYGMGVLTAWWRIYISKNAGLQIDDKDRS